MEFTNGTTLEEITDKAVSIYLKTNTTKISSLLKCRTFVRGGNLWVDLLPAQPGKHEMPVPDDAIIGRNDVDPNVEKYGIFISPNTKQGQYVQSALDAIERATS